MTPAEQANLLRYNGKPGFYEVYFVEVQDPDERTGLWVRYTLKAPSRRGKPVVMELWAVAFDREDPGKNRAHKLTVPIEEAEISQDGFRVAIRDALIHQQGCVGSLGTGDARISWDLRWDSGETLTHYPSPRMYKSRVFPKTKVISPHFDLRAHGHYTLGDTTYTLDGVPGQQSHVWGSQHAHRWIWAHCNTFEGSDAVFEGLTAQVRLGPIAAPALNMFALRYQGQLRVFNQPAELTRLNESRTEPVVDTTDYYPVSKWIVGGGDDELRFRAVIWSEADHYVGVEYEDPDGSPRVCCHSKVACMRLEILRYEGFNWRVADTLVSKSAALEFAGREPDPRIPVMV